MSVQTEIDRIITAIGNAYDSVVTKGGTVPTDEAVANLAAAIDSIPSGSGGSGFPNGTEWTQSNITSGSIYSVYNANGIWVAGSRSGFGVTLKGLYYSTDGKTWNQSNITSTHMFCVYNANGIWVAGSNNNGLYYSTDGKTWTQSNITSGNIYSVYNANGIWVAGSSGDGLYCSVTWEA